MGGIEMMEQKYGIKIRDDSFWHPLKQKFLRRYKIFTADGCQWENGLSYKGLQKECRDYGKIFLEIAKEVSS